MNQHQANLQKKEFDLKETEAKCSKLYNQLKKMRRCTKLQVSDHAVVRYLERAKGMDIEKLKSEVLSTQVINYYQQLGDGTYPIDESTTRVVIKDGVIVTIIN